jgi:hypothetical protein
LSLLLLFSLLSLLFSAIVVGYYDMIVFKEGVVFVLFLGN